jgi:FtsP/CotA-like multicopper oxidase with cupredoxin domain
MAFSTRVALVAVVGLAGAAVAASAVPSRPTHAESGAAVVAQVSPASPGPCTPSRAPGDVNLPQPPIIDTKVTPSFQIDVLNPATNSGTFFCYRIDGDKSTYVEAPTIVVREHASFTMTLKNLIPSDGSPIPSPDAHAPDGCALLNTEGTPPSPAPLTGYFGRPATGGNPPGMIANDTNFHTHGWHVPPQVDNVFKSLAMSKDGTCRYFFQLSAHKTQPPGTYWYHAHLHMLSNNQVGGGLGGTLIVLPDDAPVVKPNGPKNDVVLLVKNFNGVSPALQLAVKKKLARRTARRLTANAAPTLVPFDAFNPPATPGEGPQVGASPSPLPSYCPFTKAGDVDANGDPLGVNGIAVPSADGDALLATTPAIVKTIPRVAQFARTVKRYRIVNASSNDYVNIGMIDGKTGAAVPAMTVVGRDGVPVDWNLMTGAEDTTKKRSVERAQVFLPPSGRVDIEVFADKPYIIISRQATADGRAPNFCAGYTGFTTMASHGIAYINPLLVTSAAHRAVRPRPVSANGATAADVFANLRPTGTDRAIVFSEVNGFYVTQIATRKTGSGNGKQPWVFEEHPFWLSPPNPKTAPSPLPPGTHYNADIWVPKLRHGPTIEDWYLINASSEAHAFHIHQLTFVSLESEFEPSHSQRVYLDSIALPGARIQLPTGPTATPLLIPSVTKIQIDFTSIDTGEFVIHCHMLVHEDAGMMGVVHLYDQPLPVVHAH